MNYFDCMVIKKISFVALANEYAPLITVASEIFIRNYFEQFYERKHK